MAYTELIKNFGRIRSYMREFYLYGFKSRDDFDKKSGRSYDNERRRIESYLGNYMSFRQTPSGKNVFLSIDSRSTAHNPLYQAFKAKSFTDHAITLHFFLFDILYHPDISLTLKEITDKIDADYLSYFQPPMLFDESTVRKKLNEYISLGLIISTKHGKQMIYRRNTSFELSSWLDAIPYFSEASLLGAVGSFLLDKSDDWKENFIFKHHYITHAMESEILCSLFEAISAKKMVLIHNFSRKSTKEKKLDVIPLKIFVSVQTGRRYLLACNCSIDCIKSYRLDYITKVTIKEETPRFDELRKQLNRMQKHMWGVHCGTHRNLLEHIEFTLRLEEGEEYIYQRLEREKRCGQVIRIDQNTCRFSADVYDTSEMIPWIRTFICRILELNFSNRTIENQFKSDIRKMYDLYDIAKEDT